MAREPTTAEKKCFVIAPIGDEASEVRRRSNQVLKHVIRPAVEKCGYLATRADEIDKPGLITSQVIQRVVEDPLVVADLTGTNPNVFYELAIRHAIRKPLVQLIEKGERIPFDVAGTRTVYVDHQDLDSAASAREEIIAQIRTLEGNPSDLETPISVSLDLQQLRGSERPEDRSFAEVLSGLGEIRSQISKVIEFQDVEANTKLTEIVAKLEKSLSYLRHEEDFPSRRLGRNWLRNLPQILTADVGFWGEDLDPKALQVAMVASAFRDDAPWIYEAGMEAFRQIIYGTGRAGDDAMSKFMRVAEASVRSPLFREIFGRSERSFLALDALSYITDRFGGHRSE